VLTCELLDWQRTHLAYAVKSSNCCYDWRQLVRFDLYMVECFGRGSALTGGMGKHTLSR